jgi:hypothetical protein
MRCQRFLPPVGTAWESYETNPASSFVGVAGEVDRPVAAGNKQSQ